MSLKYVHPTMEPLVATFWDIIEVAAEAARNHRRAKAKRAPRPKAPQGLTRRPGEDSPLWNELRRRLIIHTRDYGAKAILARHLGLPRQRVGDFLASGSSMPDAERTLWLLAWVEAKEAGKKLPL